MFLRLFKRRRSAPVARERLKVLLAHERAVIGKTDLVAVLREEILAVIGRHVVIDPAKVRIKADRDEMNSTLTVDIELPSGSVVAV